MAHPGSGAGRRSALAVPPGRGSGDLPPRQNAPFQWHRAIAFAGPLAAQDATTNRRHSRSVDGQRADVGRPRASPRHARPRAATATKLPASKPLGAPLFRAFEDFAGEPFAQVGPTRMPKSDTWAASNQE